MKQRLADPGRRELLRLGLCSTALLAGGGLLASLGGCSGERPAAGYRMLREGDLPVLDALVPVLLEGAALPARMDEALRLTLADLDYALEHLSPAMLKLTRQLFDVLALPLTRGPLTGIWGAWEQASAEDIRQFLARWRNSRLDLLQMGHASLLQLVIMAWYGSDAAWAHCGYPGPPQV